MKIVNGVMIALLILTGVFAVQYVARPEIIRTDETDVLELAKLARDNAAFDHLVIIRSNNKE